MALTRPRWWLLMALSTAPGVAQAFPNGIGTVTCSNCHGGEGFDGSVELTPLGPVEAGQSVDFVLTISESSMSGAGFLVTADGVGTFSGPEGTRIIGGALAHSRPAPAANGVVEVVFSWTPPAEPGGVLLIASAVAANLNRKQFDDRWSYTALNLLWGCDGVTLYEDIDGDGYGRDDNTRVDCQPRDGWSDVPGDCNDIWSSVYPGAEEVPNGRDDNCDGEIDEGFEFAAMYPDEDGDGFGYRFGTPIEAELSLAGYSPNADDCDDSNASVNPYAEEVCNGVDDDCDRVVDEDVYDYCGVGRCAKLQEICDTECVPNPPSNEVCNGLDDDCDGEADEGAPCPTGEVCYEFRCRPESEVESAEESGSSGETSSSGTGSGGSGVGGTGQPGSEAGASGQAGSSSRDITASAPRASSSCATLPGQVPAGGWPWLVLLTLSARLGRGRRRPRAGIVGSVVGGWVQCGHHEGLRTPRHGAESALLAQSQRRPCC